MPSIDDCDDIAAWFYCLPLLTKQDLSKGLFDLPRSRYVRWHQTSGTTGRPLVVRDTAEDWNGWLDCWDRVLDAAVVTPDDVALMAFSFGPFIGFWTANDALIRRGVSVIPGGGLPTLRRLELLRDEGCTVLCATPTYALHMAAVARDSGMNFSDSRPLKMIVAGEPGGSIESTRTLLQESFNATVIDHAGGSEVGAWGYGRVDGKGLHVIESHFIAEVLQLQPDGTLGGEVAMGETGELVISNLCRPGGPVIRYRTGDIVRPAPSPDSDPNLFLQGGVIGRADDMVVIRGVNIFPSSVEAIVREVAPIAEYRVTLHRRSAMNQIDIELESAPEIAARLETCLSTRLAMRVPVQAVPDGTLPRFEAKAKRWRTIGDANVESNFPN
ncbi:MAG: AMP-binding protein [Planctomycetota bacterium]